MRALLLLGAAALAPRGAGAADAATIYRQFTAAPHVPGVLEANRHLPSHPDDVEAHGGGRPPPRPPPPPAPGVHFSSGFSDNAVLQREPAQAALYGVVAPDDPARRRCAWGGVGGWGAARRKLEGVSPS